MKEFPPPESIEIDRFSDAKHRRDIVSVVIKGRLVTRSVEFGTEKHTPTHFGPVEAERYGITLCKYLDYLRKRDEERVTA